MLQLLLQGSLGNSSCISQLTACYSNSCTFPDQGHQAFPPGSHGAMRRVQSHVCSTGERALDSWGCTALQGVHVSLTPFSDCRANFRIFQRCTRSKWDMLLWKCVLEPYLKPKWTYRLSQMEPFSCQLYTYTSLVYRTANLQAMKITIFTVIIKVQNTHHTSTDLCALQMHPFTCFDLHCLG